MVDAEPPGKANPAPRRQRARSRYRPLRLILIVLVLLAAGGVGLHFKAQADPGTEPASFNSQPPQYINVYVSEPDLLKINVTVTLGQGFYNVNYGRYESVSLRPHGPSDFEEQVDFTATATRPSAPGAILITSSTQPLAAADDFVYGAASAAGTASVFHLKNAVGGIEQAGQYAVWFQLPGGTSKTWSGAAAFNSIPIIYRDNGSTFGHLPSVGAYGSLYPAVSVFEGEYLGATGRPESLSFGKPAKTLAGEREEDFTTPDAQASYSEVVEQIVPALSNTQSAYMSPSDDASNDSDYRWQANGVDGVQPIFKAVDLDAADAQTQAAFYSGIAFGVAGSAIIALIQEIPAERRERKSSAAGGGREEPQVG